MRLSVVGRITLAQSIVQAILVFSMQTAKLQMGITSKIEQICRRFVWSGTNEHNKMGMVKWSKVCNQTASGDWVLKNLRGMSSTLLMKIGWRLLLASFSFWVQVLASKYQVDLSSVLQNLPTKYGFSLWKGSCEVGYLLVGGLRSYSSLLVGQLGS